MKNARKYADRVEQFKAAVVERRKNIKQQAVLYKGGMCQLCGYNKCTAALEFHHVNGIKKFEISKKGYIRSWEIVRDELDKCVLLCANCHREVEIGITKLPS